MSIRRLCFAALPFVFYAYACKDNDNANANPDTITGTPNVIDNDSGAATNNDEAGILPTDDAGTDGAPVAASCTGNPLVEGAVPAEIATGRFLDGPQWLDDGIVYSEVDSQTIVKNGQAGNARASLREMGLENLPIGNARSGEFIFTALSKTTAAGGGGQILRMKLNGTEPTQFPAGEANSPNDIVGSSKGFVYFTDPGYQTDGVSTGLFRMTVDGTVTTVTKVDGGVGDRYDGIALSNDEKTLFVGVYDRKQIIKYTVDEAGMPSNPAPTGIVLADNPTGLAVDSAGNLWVAESPTDLNAFGRVEVFGPTGTKFGEIPFADSRPTGVAFGGADGLTVFVTTERGNTTPGSLYTVPTHCAGVR